MYSKIQTLNMLNNTLTNIIMCIVLNMTHFKEVQCFVGENVIVSREFFGGTWGEHIATCPSTNNYVQNETILHCVLSYDMYEMKLVNTHNESGKKAVGTKAFFVP